MQCNDFLELADSYLGDELLVETNHDVIAHLEQCADCRDELGRRRGLRETLQRGFAQASDLKMREGFADELKDQLRNTSLRRQRLLSMRRVVYASIAACLLLAITFGVLLMRKGRTSPDHSNVSIALLQSAASDHRYCAIAHRLEEPPIALDEAGHRFDNAYIGLSGALPKRLPSGAKLIAVHSCVYKGQRFGHLILKYNDTVVSILVSEMPGSDSLKKGTREPGIATTRVEDYQVAHFETARHAIFVVSTLDESNNLTIARLIAPSISRHVENAESTHVTELNVNRLRTAPSLFASPKSLLKIAESDFLSQPANQRSLIIQGPQIGRIFR